MRVHINLRVYRRTQDNIVLLWDTTRLTEEQKSKANVDVLVKKVGEEENFNRVRFVLAKEFEGETVQMPQGIEMCVIPYIDNNLEMDEVYVVKVTLGKQIPIEEYLKVYEYGVLSEDEKDRRAARAHLMLWDEKRKKWRKATGVETKAGFGILVVLSK